ncbi:MAG: hypothetical protein ACI80V_002033 [Rhodothermales bacterium]|jgi:hypothetical protein
MTQRLFTFVPAAALVLLLALSLPWSDADTRVFEMRTYTTNEGKLDFLHKRFRDHTNGLFEKHGMELVGYWTPTEGETASNTLVYILAYPSREARDASWKAFGEDPDWQAVYKASHEEAGGRIVTNVESVFMQPTDYSPIK